MLPTKCSFLLFVFLNLVKLHVCVLPSLLQLVKHLVLCVCLCVYPCPFPFTAVISAHPIHSLDNHHHHYHMGSLASPTRSYLYHQGSGHPRPHACATPISHLDRVDSSGETLPPAGRQEKYRGGRSHSFIELSFIHSDATQLHSYFSFPKCY